MAATKSIPSPEYLNECFVYNQETGVLTWKKRPLSHFKNQHGCDIANTTYTGKQAGAFCSQGYMRTTIRGRGYKNHRIAWAMTYGEWPKLGLDHINGDKSDNRIANLRQATCIENAYNTGAQRDNKCGYKGVWPGRNGRYGATVNRVYLGFFETAELAYAACCAARESLHGEFVNHGG
jgi:hypothetical protein